jgi:cyclohexa-1,5-dienecarbonyl-CoA hydratase
VNPISSRTEHSGAVLRLVLDRPKGNVVDAAMCDALLEILATLPDAGPLRCVVIEGSGRHFSFGASVAEHAPDEVGAMLPRFHALIRALVGLPIPTVALLRGQCLGGGLEVAAACGILLAESGAKLGQPEIQLGVFAPAASVLLPARIGQARAEHLLLTGGSITATEAAAAGLVAKVFAVGEGEAGLQEWLAANIVPRSAVALRFATRAARAALVDEVDRRLLAIESLYLQGLMAHADPAEGIASFLERRPAKWSHA